MKPRTWPAVLGDGVLGSARRPGVGAGNGRARVGAARDLEVGLAVVVIHARRGADSKSLQWVWWLSWEVFTASSESVKAPPVDRWSVRRLRPPASP